VSRQARGTRDYADFPELHRHSPRYQGAAGVERAAGIAGVAYDDLAPAEENDACSWGRWTACRRRRSTPHDGGLARNHSTTMLLNAHYDSPEEYVSAGAPRWRQEYELTRERLVLADR